MPLLVNNVDQAQQRNKRGRPNAFRRCIFTLADLGKHAPGRKHAIRKERTRMLPTWSLQSRTEGE